MYTDIKTFEDACKVLALNPENLIPDFSFFPESDKQAMIDHSKLVIIAKAINGDWVPNWKDYDQYKYYPWFEMGSSSGVGFSYRDCVIWRTGSSVGSRLCFESREKAKYVGKQFEYLYKSYFVKE
ncbi:hypothetical protein [Flavobacterium sp. GT3P67]|uniref:hypothetical protein n=1 Tax=Flavobacterium sp. GT3P67 TaxID=2541722 RepID=UPI0010450FDE|nr:hypothetical protein [Flavobacterium sp. GT3P67]TDE53787.1 hypothetical protein E0H99_07155 [Flavobacterium sp. GT3P67]